MFQDLNRIVYEQEEPVKQIERKASDVVNNVRDGVDEQSRAITSARAARKKKWICFWICGKLIKRNLCDPAANLGRSCCCGYSSGCCWCICRYTQRKLRWLDSHNARSNDITILTTYRRRGFIQFYRCSVKVMEALHRSPPLTILQCQRRRISGLTAL